MQQSENGNSVEKWEERLIEAARKEVFSISGSKTQCEKPSGSSVSDSTIGSPYSDDTRAERCEIPFTVSGSKRIGQYHTTSIIGEGGMGIVYKAVQENPRRTVAIKVMRNRTTSPSSIRRFEYESQILARLKHPGIAHVYEAGWYINGDQRVPYFAMEFIRGARPIVKFAQREKLSTSERIAQFIEVCEAVHHGHQRGIIHRDLKPSNLLVDAEGKVKVIDFGVARSVDANRIPPALQTSMGEMPGTLSYMSPEQRSTDPQDLDIRSDVYSLGVVLFELLSETILYDVKGKTYEEALRVIREQPPTRLGSIDRSFRGDLETIVEKAMEKDRRRRYQSVLALADDLRRYLRTEPILARPPSAVYRLRKLVRRRRTTFAVSAILMVAAFGTAIERARAWNLVRERDRLVEDLQLMESAAYLADDEGHPVERSGMLRTCTRAIDAGSKNAMVHALRARIYFLAKDYVKANTDCEQALELDPRNILALRTCALTHFKRGEEQTARNMYEQVLDTYRYAADLPRDFHNRAILRRRHGEYDKALQDHDVVVALRPDKWKGFTSRGITRYMMGDSAGAIDDLERAASLADIPAVQCYLWIFEIRMRRNEPGDRSAADDALKKAEEAAKSDPRAEGMLAVWRGIKDPQEHLKSLKKEGDIAQAHYYTGVKALLEGKEKEAIHQFKLAAVPVFHGYNEFDLAQWHLQRLMEDK